MTRSTRGSLDFAKELDDLDIDPPAESTAPAVASAAGFYSREPGDTTSKPRARRRRTGRTAQFNVKARPETIAAFTQVADAQGWGLGETLEHAVALLEKTYGSGSG
ncbi:MAG: stability/partitioning determinant [Pseudomonadota bacterium]